MITGILVAIGVVMIFGGLGTASWGAGVSTTDASNSPAWVLGGGAVCVIGVFLCIFAMGVA